MVVAKGKLKADSVLNFEIVICKEQMKIKVNVMQLEAIMASR